MEDNKHWSCKRCGSKKFNLTIDRSKWCKNCGQRFEINGGLIPSFDRRTLKEQKMAKVYSCDSCGGTENISQVKVVFRSTDKSIKTKSSKIVLGEMCHKCGAMGAKIGQLFDKAKAKK